VPFKQLLAREGFAFLDVDFRGLDRLRRPLPRANHGEWGNADTHDMVDAGRWVAAQPWSNGRVGIYGGSYGGYLVLSALVDEPSLWDAGSTSTATRNRRELPSRRSPGPARPGPDDGLARRPVEGRRYRRGSPLYRPSGSRRRC
jgi:dipeptidyl aminopeptidase/acylaminoacyl peptidase